MKTHNIKVASAMIINIEAKSDIKKAETINFNQLSLSILRFTSFLIILISVYFNTKLTII